MTARKRIRLSLPADTDSENTTPTANSAMRNSQLRRLSNGTASASPHFRRLRQLDEDSLSDINDVPEINDEEERNQRKKERIRKANEARRSVATGTTMTQAQIAEHYANCIKLSAENKINIRNAFSLQLIDYMTEMLRNHAGDLASNFQIAGCTLDASAKIYAYRVDRVHTDTLKIAGELSSKEQENEGGMAQADEGDESNSALDKTKKIPKKVRRGKTIETNLKNIDILPGGDFDVDFGEDASVFSFADPVLLKQMACRMDDAGGSDGEKMFLSLLSVDRDDCIDLMLQLDSVPGAGKGKSTDTCSVDRVPLTCFPELKGVIDKTFGHFNFSGWSAEQEDKWNMKNQENDEDMDTEHAYDPTAVPEPVEDMDVCYDNIGDDGAVDDDVASCFSHTFSGPSGLSDIISFMSSLPSEYSYFDKRLVRMYGGSKHWRILPCRNDPRKRSDGVVSKRRRKAELVPLQYDEFSEYEKCCIIKKAASQKHSVGSTSLLAWPENIEPPANEIYNLQDVYRLFDRPDMHKFLLEEKKNKTAHVDDQVGDYDYNNLNDSQCCPADENEHQYDDDDGIDDCPLPCSQPDEFTSQFAGDNLVTAPNKVSHFTLPYAKMAKKMDMRKLKGTVWRLLSFEEDKENQTVSKEDGDNHLAKTMGTRQVTFSQIYSQLPSNLNSQMAENLSCPLAFMALLHLCNERVLRLDGNEDMSDFTVKQDEPPPKDN